MQTGKITNHPFAILLFPVKRRSPVLLIHFLPAGGMPPAKILITTVVHEFKIVAITHGRTIDEKVFEKDLVVWLLIVECKVVTEPRAVARSLRVLIEGPVATARGSVTYFITKLKQSALNLHHPVHTFNRDRRRRDCRIKLIAKQVLDVINQQFLMLHLVFKTEPYDRENRFCIFTSLNTLDESRHVLIDMRAIMPRLFHSRTRARATLRSRHARTEPFVIRVEVKEKLVRVSLVSRLIGLQHRLKKPGCVTNVPTRRTHELRGLNDIVFDLQRRNNLECAGANLLIEIRYVSTLSLGRL